MSSASTGRTMRADASSSAFTWHAGWLNNGIVFGATCHLVARLPRGVSYAIGHVGTWMAYRLMRRGTRALIGNLRVVRPDAPGRELKRLALLTYRCYGRDTIDFIRSLSMSRDQFEPMMSTFDSSPLVAALARKRGVLLVGGHYGNWEMGAVALRLFHDFPLTVVSKAESSPAVGVIRRRMRRSLGVETLEIGQMLDTALRVRKQLASNGVVAMLLERHLGRDRVDVQFFGRQAGFLRSPAMIAYMSGAPLVPAYMLRQADNRFEGSIGEPIIVDTTRPVDEAVKVATQAFASQLEVRIRANPQLWYQFYPYWRNDDGDSPPTPADSRAGL